MKRYFWKEKNRLVYIDKQADKRMWEERWKEYSLRKLFYSHKHSKSSSKIIIEITKKYLPLGSDILEGGCGLGYNVFSLREAGYNTIGVDYAVDTISRVTEFMPDLDVRFGDLNKMDFQDFLFDGYWSLGVIEHFYTGYQDIAEEMVRVLKPGGYLFITVPAVSPIRKLKAKLHIFPLFSEDKINLCEFYQYAFSSEEIQEFFGGLGFKFIEKLNWNVYKGVSDEIPGMKLLMRFLCKFCDSLPRYLLKYFYHMHLFVFQK
jgi:SAM-dependent methyltransferase